MNSVIIFGASDLIFLIAVAFAVVLLFVEDRTGRMQLLVSAVIGLVLVLGLIMIAAAVHNDPRPFVQNPALRPLISHSRDNGFPSDHSAAAGLMASLIAIRHRVWGAVLAGAAVLVAWARVAAHVHHVQDVVAGLLIGALAAWIATVIAAAALRRVRAPLAARLRG